MSVVKIHHRLSVQYRPCDIDVCMSGSRSLKHGQRSVNLEDNLKKKLKEGSTNEVMTQAW